MPFPPSLTLLTLLSRSDRTLRFVRSRQRFVRRCHGDPAGRSMLSTGTSPAVNSDRDWFSIPMAGGGLSRLAIARLKSAGVPVAPLLKRADARADRTTGRNHYLNRVRQVCHTGS